LKKIFNRCSRYRNTLATTTEISKEKKPKTFEENKKIAKQ
jgi:hypothetical protein